MNNMRDNKDILAELQTYEESIQSWLQAINSVASTWKGDDIHTIEFPDSYCSSTLNSEGDPLIEKILLFWFRGNDSDSILNDNSMHLWFCKTLFLDNQIRSIFFDHWSKAIKEEYQFSSKRGSIAFIILLDQMTRNMCKDSISLFSGNLKCRHIVDILLSEGIDDLSYHYWVWIIIALTRSEDLECINKGWKLLESRLEKEPNHSFIQVLQNIKNTLLTRQEELNKFGRYPYRNALLGRSSTREEIRYLKKTKTIEKSYKILYY